MELFKSFTGSSAVMWREKLFTRSVLTLTPTMLLQMQKFLGTPKFFRRKITSGNQLKHHILATNILAFHFPEGAIYNKKLTATKDIKEQGCFTEPLVTSSDGGGGSFGCRTWARRCWNSTPGVSMQQGLWPRCGTLQPGTSEDQRQTICVGCFWRCVRYVL